MTEKSVLMRPRGLRPRARVPSCPLFATPLVEMLIFLLPIKKRLVVSFWTATKAN